MLNEVEAFFFPKNPYCKCHLPVETTASAWVEILILLSSPSWPWISLPNLKRKVLERLPSAYRTYEKLNFQLAKTTIYRYRGTTLAELMSTSITYSTMKIASEISGHSLTPLRVFGQIMNGKKLTCINRYSKYLEKNEWLKWICWKAYFNDPKPLNYRETPFNSSEN